MNGFIVQFTDTAMETLEDDLRRFILEQEEEDDDFF
jgi:hypothetical protein